MLEKTLVIYKPDAVSRNLIIDITTTFQNRGLILVDGVFGQYSREFWEEFYAEHKGKDFYEGLVEYMSSGLVYATVWYGDNAIRVCRQLAGATDPLQADPGSIRGRYGLTLPMNTVHCSDSPESAEREIRLFFGGGSQ